MGKYLNRVKKAIDDAWDYIMDFFPCKEVEDYSTDELIAALRWNYRAGCRINLPANLETKAAYIKVLNRECEILQAEFFKRRGRNLSETEREVILQSPHTPFKYLNFRAKIAEELKVTKHWSRNL